MNHPGLMFLLFVGSLLTVNSLPQNIAENIDSSQLPQQDINTLNCFNLVEESQWSEVLELDQVTATLSLRVERAGQPVVTCLARQTVQYIISVVGDIQSQPFLLSDLHSWSGSSEQLVQHPPVFQYLIYPGNYRLRVTHCGADQNDGDECSQDTTTVFSQFLSVQQSSSSSSSCSSSSLSSNTSLVSVQSPSLLSGHSAVFHFSFDPCSQIQEYDRANISLFTAQLPGDCGLDSPQLVDQVLVTRAGDLASVQYHSPELPGDSFYCLSVSLSHISCRLATVPTPKYCYLQSEPLWLPQAPIISFLLPLCSDHLACAWLYIVVGAGSCLLVSCVLAVCCVSCCDKCRSSSSRKHDEVDFSGDVISLAPLHEKISWSDLHKEWDTREDKARGKILLLFSPDTKLFKELQEAFKSFLDLACHCDIYDLFDDALFDTIALDPSEWLQEFVNDEDVKILVISSAGAHRRQLALKGEQPLNLPDNSLLDGLFTSGLRFVSAWPGLNSGRVATARYEMLHLTDESHKLASPLAGASVREFLVPTQLHELFCWVHHLKPLDLIGKPWGNYHLEMQLLQDALKLVRRDKSNQVSIQNLTATANFREAGNGVTMI